MSDNVPMKWRVLAHKWVDGADIEFRNDSNDYKWESTRMPSWKIDCQYRVKPDCPEVDWSSVDKRFNYLTRNSYGELKLWEVKPHITQSTAFQGWNAPTGSSVSAAGFSSLKAGTCDWKDSLVERCVN